MPPSLSNLATAVACDPSPAFNPTLGFGMSLINLFMYLPECRKRNERFDTSNGREETTVRGQKLYTRNSIYSPNNLPQSKKESGTNSTL